MSLSVKQEEALGLSILQCLERADPMAALAGGAPRDWYFNANCNDLDFYYRGLPEITVDQERTRLTGLLGHFGGHPVFTNSEKIENRDRDQYKRMKCLKRIWRTEIAGKSIQIMELHPDTDMYYFNNDFPCSLSNIKYQQGKLWKSRDFALTEASGVIFKTNDEYSWDDPYLKKIHERFITNGDYVRGDKKVAENRVLSKTLNGLM